MKHRVLTAIQFGIWTLAASELIPFSGLFMLPVLWMLDRKIALTVQSIAFWMNYTYYLGPLNAIPNIQKYGLVPWIPVIILLAWPVTLLGNMIDMMIGAWWIRRKLRKKAPDILQHL